MWQLHVSTVLCSLSFDNDQIGVTVNAEQIDATF